MLPYYSITGQITYITQLILQAETFTEAMESLSDDDDVSIVVESPQPAKTHTPFEYTLKMINPSRMSEYKNVNIRGQKYCSSLDELREFIAANLPTTISEVPDLESVDMGFVEPGHGGKGRKVWMFDNEDLQNMYEAYSKKKRILLWCYTQRSQKTTQSIAAGGKGKDTSKGATKVTSKRSSNYDSQVRKQEEVDEIFQKLNDKHSGKYKPEQLRTWAHMYHLKTHDSIDHPPDKPFFRGNARKREIPSSSQGTPESKKLATVGVSPGRRVNIRSELIDQLKKCQELADTGAISKEIFDDLQHTILDDIKKL